jgi:hypothetical protein
VKDPRTQHAPPSSQFALRGLQARPNYPDHGNNLYLANSDGSNQTTPPGPVFFASDARHPAWSPDGTEVAYVKGGNTIVVKPATGGAAAQTVTPDWPPGHAPGGYHDPDWAQTGGPGQAALTVAVHGTGSGTVTGAGINCPSQCSRSYAAGTSVILTASAQHGSVFGGWGGDCAGTHQCHLAMNGDHHASANFLKLPGTKITKTTISSRAKAAAFSFKAIGHASGFQCALTRHGKPRFSKCGSPKSYKHLKAANYTFRVRAIIPRGADPTPARKSFTIH